MFTIPFTLRLLSGVFAYFLIIEFFIAILALCFIQSKYSTAATIIAIVVILTMLAPTFQSEVEINEKIIEVETIDNRSRIKVAGFNKWIYLTKQTDVTVNCTFLGSATAKQPASHLDDSVWSRIQPLPYYSSRDFDIRCPSMTKQVTKSDGRPWLQLIGLGKRSPLLHEQLTVLAQQGLIHLFVVSGLHFALVIGSLTALAQRIFKRFGKDFDAAWLLIMSVTTGVIMYSVMEAGIGALRVLAGIFCIGLLTLTRRRLSSAHTFVLVLAITWAIEPNMHLGMVLSFGAVAVIAISYQTRAVSKLHQFARIQIALTLCLSAILLYSNFIASVALNTILIPIWGAVLFSVWLLLSIDSTLADQSERLIDTVVNQLQLIPTPLFSLPGSFSIILILCAVSIFILPKRLSILFGTLALLIINTPTEKYLKVLDVGQGSSSYFALQQPVIIDSGPPRGLGFHWTYPTNANYLFSTHSDSDHTGNDLKLIQNGQVRMQMGDYGVPCTAGQFWLNGHDSIEVISPLKNAAAKNRSNNVSCVYLYRGAKNILIMGDGDVNSEHRMLIQQVSQLNAEVLIVGHHGSKSSTSWALLANIKPDIALISAGAPSRFGHPSPVIEQRLSHFNVKPLVTHRAGAITLPLSNQSRAQSACSRVTIKTLKCQ